MAWTDPYYLKKAMANPMGQRDPCNPPLPNVMCVKRDTHPSALGNIEKSFHYPKFKKGGRVKKTGVAMVHKGEYVLPVGVKPTKTQIKKVAKKRKCKGGKHCKCKRK